MAIPNFQMLMLPVLRASAMVALRPMPGARWEKAAMAVLTA